MTLLIVKLVAAGLFVWFCLDSWKKHNVKYYLWYIYLILLVAAGFVLNYYLHNFLSLTPQAYLLVDKSGLVLDVIVIVLIFIIGILHMRSRMKN